MVYSDADAFFTAEKKKWKLLENPSLPLRNRQKK
jgi:hypothetical protein